MSLIKTKNKILIIILIVTFSITTPQNVYANDASPEYAIKAAYIYNILRFVEWPDSSILNNNINVCLLGKNNFDGYLDLIQTREVSGNSIQLNIINSLGQARTCQLVFIGDSSTFPTREVIKVLGDTKIVVVGDNKNFTKNGGMFAFFIEDKKVRLSLNKNTLERSGLKISSLLFEVCQILDGET